MRWIEHPAGNTKGALAEQLARLYLRAYGYRCLAQNYWCYHGELDLIVFHARHRELVFVEVKLRSHSQFGGAAEALSRDQRRRIWRSAEHFVQHHPAYEDSAMRFDVVLFQHLHRLPNWVQDVEMQPQ